MRCLVCRGEFSDSMRKCPHCATRDDELLRKVLTEDEPPPVEELTTQRFTPVQRGSVGVIYLLRAGSYYKIGKSTKPADRYARLAIQLPEPAEVVHEIETNDIDYLEKHWHRYFHEKRRNGEWFTLSAEDVAEFTRCRVVWLDWR